MTPAVSIVVPTFNGMTTLPALFDAIGSQRGGIAVEIVAIDSGSTDGTADFARRRADTFLPIPPQTFDHGLTRNLGASRARGELVVLIVQDALPASDAWLAALVAPFADDATLAGTLARQRVRDDASAVTRYYHSRWAAASETPRVRDIPDKTTFDALDPMAKFEACIFDNVWACVRRSVWSDHQFRATPIGEDVIWAKEVLLAGYRLAYVPQAVVVHSHDRRARYEFWRTFALHRVLYEQFGLRTIPTPGALVRS